MANTMDLQTFCRRHEIAHSTVYRAVRKIISEHEHDLDAGDSLSREHDLDFEEYGFSVTRKVGERRLAYEVYDENLLERKIMLVRGTSSLPVEQIRVLKEAASFAYSLAYSTNTNWFARDRNGSPYRPNDEHWNTVKHAIEMANLLDSEDGETE